MKKAHVQHSDTFWDHLPRPFFVLAPMANVTDSVFRKLFATYGKPDVTWTEFVSADGLISPGRERLLVDLDYSKSERPIVAQLFTGHPEAMKKAAALAKELKFDGVDINMGCPDRAVEKQGGGANLIKNPETALKVLEAARQGWTSESAPQRHQKVTSSPNATSLQLENLPISIKTRLGYNSVDLDWIHLLLEQRLPVLTVHLRTRKEMSEVPAHWELMPEIVKLRNEISPSTLIIGNGDVESLQDARAKAKKYGCDGIMIGRGIFGKPWFFADHKKEKTPEERLKILLEHTKAFEKAYCGLSGIKPGKKRLKSFAVMKKHFKAYVNGWDNAKELRAKLMETNSYKEVKEIIEEYLKLL